MFDRYDISQRALLVHIDFLQEKDSNDLQEFQSLVSSAGIETMYVITGRRRAQHPKYFIGEGKAHEIAEAVNSNNIGIVIFDHQLSPAKERNLERLFNCRVIDRTGLILYIFAQRARTHEGKLQVKFAQLCYLATRLVGGWTHLERQKGGIGLRGGPGETQLEVDRRLLRNRTVQIKSQLIKIEKQRNQSRQARIKAIIPTVSLVGYTNAGKSTLFNQITEAKVLATPDLFATLDPTLRYTNLSNIGKVAITDTVGFIDHLPHDLIAAFKATLQETSEAKLLLHVVDASDTTAIKKKVKAVDKVLEEIGARGVQTLRVMNKIDVSNEFKSHIDRDEEGKPNSVWISARTGTGMSLLFQSLEELLGSDMVRHELCFPPQERRLISRFYRINAIEKEWVDDCGRVHLSIYLPMISWCRLCKQETSLRNYLT